MEKEKDYKEVATKLRPSAYRALINICAKKHITMYNLLQMVCDTLVRYMSDAHNLTPEMERAMVIFEGLEGWANAFNSCDPGTASTEEVTEATYYVGDKSHSGVRAIHVTHPFFDKWEQTENIQLILERTLCLMFPERYRRMRLLAVNMECSSLLELIDKLLDSYISHEDLAQVRSQFEDANRSDFGTKPSDERYKRKMHKDVDAPDLQKTISFDDYDREIADMEVEDGTL